jgi:polar amino acid transport system substrate-binding protein
MSTLAHCANLLCIRTFAPIRIAFACLVLPLCLAFAEEPLPVFYNERPPYLVSGTGGEVTGLTADPTAYALRKARIPFKWVAMPSARQIYLLQENQAKLSAVGWFKNPEREKFAKFSTALYQDKQTVVLARSDNRKIAAIRSVEELLSDRSLKLLRKFGYSYGQDLDERIIRLAPVSLQVTVENVNMIQMIQVRRADYMFIAPEEAGRAIALAGLRSADFHTRTLPDMPHGEKRYLLFSQLVDDDTIRLVNKYIDEYVLARK